MPLPRETRYTGTRYLELMRHRLGKTPASRHRLIDTFNEAGRALFIAAAGAPHFHHWSWAVCRGIPLIVKPNLNYIELPDDFGTLVKLTQEQNLAGSVQLTSVTHLDDMVADSTISTFDLFVAFETGDTARVLDVDGIPKKVASIFPTQTAARTITISYRRTWIDFSGPTPDQPTAPSTLNRVPNIPAEWDRLMRLAAQAFADEIENGTSPFDNEPFSAELDRLVAYDAGRQPSKGSARHSVMDQAQGGGYRYPHRGITRP